MRKVYFDYAAATYIDPAVFKKMAPYLKGVFGNPSSLHSSGREAKTAIENARADTAKILGATPREIIFTGSGTESNNLALFGIANAYKNNGSINSPQRGKHIIVSKIEHKSVLEPAKKLEKEGFKISYLNVDSGGFVKLIDLKNALTKKTILVSIIYANNEIGTIQSISKIAKIIRDFRKKLEIRNWKLEIDEKIPFFHIDACQAAGVLDLNVKKLGIDLMTLNSSKIYGPKGIGCLYINEKLKIENGKSAITPLIMGGSQEFGLRAGTENTAAIIGFSEALKLAEKIKNKENKRLKNLRDYFIKNLKKKIPNLKLNGHPQKRLPNNINISIPDIDGEALLLMLDRFGIYASTGSACAANDTGPSHVLSAIGLSKKLINGSLRITLGRKTTKKDIDYALKILAEIVEKLR